MKSPGEKMKRLFEPIKIGNVELKNRIVMAPMVTQYTNSDGTVSDRLAEYYARRAGGMEAARIAARRGHEVSLWEKEDRLGGKLTFAC